MTQITTTAVGGTSAGLKLKGLTDAEEIQTSMCLFGIGLVFISFFLFS